MQITKYSSYSFKIPYYKQFIINEEFRSRYNIEYNNIINTYKIRSLLYKINVINKVNQINIDRTIKRCMPKIYHATSKLYKVPSNIKKVVTIHDCIPESISELHLKNILPETFNIREWKTAPVMLKEKEKQLEESDKIIAISFNTKMDILKYYPQIESDKISVIYHGGATDYRTQKISVPDTYILFVGTRKMYKNFHILVDAFEKMVKTNPHISLLCVGGGVFTREEQQIFIQKSLSGKIYHYNDVNNHVLSYIYQHAALFVFPSLYEGFGIPILEAFQNNCPVILSNSSCFPEIAADAALYFNMYDKDDLYDKLKIILYDKDTQSMYKKLGKKRVTDFSWKKSSDKHNELYNSL
jgi:glycosyltransferase involved in cell wall biosynthesis